MVVSVPLGGMIADRFRQPIGVILVSCLAFALLLSAATRIDVTSWMIFPLIGLLGGLAAGPIMSLPARVLGAETRALGMGLFFTMFYAMQAAGPWLAGRLSAWRGDAAAAFDAGAAFLVVTMGLVYVFLLLSARPSLARKASLP
jgi:MFS-type transporter involved in bile tolerance (Atg22 family)